MNEGADPIASWTMDAWREAAEGVRRRCGGDPGAEAEGHRFLSRVFAAMREFVVEQDPDFPDFTPVMSPTRKYFADNPDTHYDRAPLRPDRVYRVRGQRGTCAYLSFCAYAVSVSGARILGSLSDREITFDEDGRFEIILSAQRPAGSLNWLPLERGARTLVARQYFLDRKKERPASYEIACLDAEPSDHALEFRALAKRFPMLRDAFSRAVNATFRASDAWSGSANVVSFDSGASGLLDLFPTPDNQYAGGWFRLAPDEALILEVTPPDCRYWSVHLLSRWLESLDGRRAVVSLNKAQAVMEDGRARFAIAARNPAMPNWLDTRGRQEGFFLFRWMQTEQAPARPICRVVTLG